MILRTLRLLSFRAHAETHVSFASKINLIYGRNGAGKTNLLEAVHYLALSKSFIASQDQYALRTGCPYFEVEGRFEGEQRADLRVRLAYIPSEGKRIFLNSAPLDRLSQIVGMLPVVIFTPADHAITAGGPEERRRFLDNILSQAHPVYLDDLLKYRRALQQRNALLAEYRRARRKNDPLLESWDAELVSLGSRIIERRARFLQAFARHLSDAYHRIEAVGEKPSIEYATIAPLPAEPEADQIAGRYWQRLHEVSVREREQGRTLAGPHRDELVFRLNDFAVRQYASQGQHRTFGMALKLAKYFYLRENLEETPLLLLDDVFGDLDQHRTRVFLELLRSDVMGQSFITATTDEPFRPIVPFDQPENQRFLVEAGRVRTAGQPASA